MEEEKLADTMIRRAQDRKEDERRNGAVLL